MAWTTEHQTRQDAIDTAVATIAESLTRAAYEETCERFGIEPSRETSVPMTAESGCWSLDNDQDGTRQIRQTIAQRRNRAIKAEKLARIASIEIEIACPSCGMSVTRTSLMSASLGTACPNCYDRMSA